MPVRCVALAPRSTSGIPARLLPHRNNDPGCGMTRVNPKRRDERRDLYDPSFEHDACGVGMICNIDGSKIRSIVEDALTILRNLDHRGARGNDPETGDGAGILLQIPDRFFRDELQNNIELPIRGAYAVGMVFLSRERQRYDFGVKLIERAARETGLTFLGWRDVPVDERVIGATALRTSPVVRQFFVAGSPDEDELERDAYFMRRRVETADAYRDRDGRSQLYVCSLSARTIVYKGMLTVEQLDRYFLDLQSPLVESAVALVHSRFSTNTLPTWALAHPFRMICHNGEINTLRGNVNRMRAREDLIQRGSHDESALLKSVLTPGGSDSQNLDNALELLVHGGHSLPKAMMMLVPEAWEKHEDMEERRRAFYEFHACLMEPWDGPATIPFTDGRIAGAVLDRNGLRPSRYTVTCDGRVILASEAGVLDVDPADVLEHGRLTPGRMFLVDLQAGRIVDDAEVKHLICSENPYAEWIAQHLVTLDDLSDDAAGVADISPDVLRFQQLVHGYSREDIDIILAPMARDSKEPIGSMGNDTALAVLSEKPRLLFDYFKQLFAQVTNPPIDAIREERVTSLNGYLGKSGDILNVQPAHAAVLELKQPILSVRDLGRIRSSIRPEVRSATVSTTFPAIAGTGGLESAVRRICREAEEAVRDGARLIILSDRDVDERTAPAPSLLAASSVHHHLIGVGLRSRCSVIVESGEPREVHHFCALLGFGAEAVCPYLALEVVGRLAGTAQAPGLSVQAARENYVKAVGSGILKVMSKMGISTLRSYVGAQVFEALGLSHALVDEYFSGTVSRIGGVGMEGVAEDVIERHSVALQHTVGNRQDELPDNGIYRWRRAGEEHLFDPVAIARLQQAVRDQSFATYDLYAALINERTRGRVTLRGLLEFAIDPSSGVPLDEVQPWTEIVTSFKSGAMSYGSLSLEAHETLAKAMNSIGAKSNSGEGGEASHRLSRDNPARSRIKQVASGRFGVTIEYLSSADEIQIKMAQGAKPGEGGQLPAHKVYPWIAETRFATPWVGLISPPPHHDIYSIEDLSQLIFDLRNANPAARISVKLVSEVGVGTVAAGVAKGGADVILISGHDGGTGASPQTSLMHAGLPWELGLSEAHQTLVRNGLRTRVKLECDGQLKTGRDVAIAAMLGADEFGFATAPLVAMGCVMMRKCHLNTCPVGIATQDPELRRLFKGTPDHVINYLHFVAEELRAIMSKLGIRTLDALVGRVDLLRQRSDTAVAKSRGIDLSRILAPAKIADHARGFADWQPPDSLRDSLDHELIRASAPAIDFDEKVSVELSVRNIHRSFGTLLSGEVVRRRKSVPLADDAIRVSAAGTAGQSFGAFLTRGVTIAMTGQANDYFGKGLSGGRLILRPPATAAFDAHHNTIVGNVALYGATSGELFVNGRAGERFAVRNSGATAVVEGTGDHCCEYMTGGVVVVLGSTGRNFGAGMSGGIAYVMDGTGDFRDRRWNREMVELHRLDEADVGIVRELVGRHASLTGSAAGQWIVDNWDDAVGEFVKVFPTEYRLALERARRQVGGTEVDDERPKATISLDRDGLSDSDKRSRRKVSEVSV